jgi:replication factor C large subunit
LSAGIALSKDEKYPGFTCYQRTQRILKLWQSKMKNAKKIAIAEKLAQKTHSSTREVVKNTLPFFQHIFKNSKTQQKQFIKEFDLAEEEVAWLKK